MRRLYYFLIALLPLTAMADDVTISTAKELSDFATAVNEGNTYAGTTVLLAADIDLADIDWIPIGTTTNPFRGTFDGQGHRISNMKVDVDGNVTGDVAGLFGFVGESGIVRRVGVQSGSVHISAKTAADANCYVGGIVGLNYGHIEQCANHATVIGNYTMACVGGIAGASGIVGGGTSTTAIIEDCYNQGELFTNATGATDVNYLGGIVGNNGGTVRRVYSYAEISEAAKKGDICGYSITDVENAYADGDAMKGSALDGKLNTAGDYSVWTFADDQLPVLTWLAFPVVTLYNNADNTATLDANDGQTCNVVLSGRTLYKDGSWNTLTLPFALSSLDGTPLEGATLMSLSSAAFKDHTLTLQFADATSIEAGKPYIIKWISGSDIANPTFQNVTLSTALTAEEYGNTITDEQEHILTFKGNYAPVTLAANDRQKLYLSADNKLYYPNADVTVGAFRAYFVLDDALYAGEPADNPDLDNARHAMAVSFALSFGDDDNDPTGIESQSLNVAESQSIYDLQGRKVSQSASTLKGIYILNGKKVIFP